MANSVFLFPGTLQLGGGLGLSGHLLFTPDNTYDIGASLATRPRTGYFGTSLVSPILAFNDLGSISAPSNGIFLFKDNAGTAFSRLQLGGTTNAFPSLQRNSTFIVVRLADNSGYGGFVAASLEPFNAYITSGSGTGITLLENGTIRRLVYKVTVLYTAFITAGATADVTIGTLPAKTRVLGIQSDTTIAYAGLAGTIQLSVGHGASFDEFLVLHDVKTAAIVRGNADSDLGTGIARASAIQGGSLPSWTGTTAIKARIASGTGNVGDGAATLMSAGSTTYYIMTERMP